MTQRTNSLGQPIGPDVPNWKAPARPPREALQGRWCRLEPLDPDRHAEDLFQANQLDEEGRIWTYLPYGPFATLSEYRTWLEQAASESDPLFFAIRRGPEAESQAAGVASLLRITPAAGSIEIGHICYSPALQRTRAATEAMYLLMKLVFDLGYRRYEWKCDALNEPSRRAAVRLGFSYEGLFRQALIYKGRNRDTGWYSAIDQDWPRLRARYETWLDPGNFARDGSQIRALSVTPAARQAKNR